ncbi:MAG: NDP-mannose synthase [Thermoleophilaceae bacterium]|nr:NDP-mannose synthase [Thermoleophilaceae bacterium]
MAATGGDTAVILAGGRGTRLAPFTTVLPKPLMPLGNHSILEVVVRQLAKRGFTQLKFSVGYLAHLIEAVFGDGSRFGVEIEYLREEEPRGTAGVLADLRDEQAPFLVMNGDILTTLDYRQLYDVHREAGNAMTIATHHRSVRSDYGVLHLGGQLGATNQVTGWEEKPEQRHVVSMGIYIVDPAACAYVAGSGRTDIPDVVLSLLGDEKPVGAYPYDGLWLDIGRHDDYELAVAEYEKLADEPLGEAPPTDPAP